eukprot:g7549.t1
MKFAEEKLGMAPATEPNADAPSNMSTTANIAADDDADADVKMPSGDALRAAKARNSPESKQMAKTEAAAKVQAAEGPAAVPALAQEQAAAPAAARKAKAGKRKQRKAAAAATAQQE